jgi:peptide methionine sulfoxide reductase MsrA
MESSEQTILLGGGCFWSIEAVFRHVKGVVSVRPGYVWAGFGDDVNIKPAHHSSKDEQACRIEVVEVTWNSEALSLEDILEVFFASHAASSVTWGEFDVSQYRSVIVLPEKRSPEGVTIMDAKVDFISYPEKLSSLKIASSFLQNKKISCIANSAPKTRIFTASLPSVFVLADPQDHDYFSHHKNDPFCLSTIAPKVNRLADRFRNLYQSQPLP